MVSILLTMSRLEEKFRGLSQCILMCNKNEKVDQEQSLYESYSVNYGAHLNVKNTLLEQ